MAKALPQEEKKVINIKPEFLDFQQFSEPNPFSIFEYH